MNVSKSGASFSFGKRGARVSVGRRGRRTTLGIPGTGLSYTKTKPWGSSKKKKKRRKLSPAKHAERGTAVDIPLERRMNPSFWKRIGIPAKEIAVLKGCSRIEDASDYGGALQELQKARKLPDGALIAGLAALRLGDFARAEKYLLLALKNAKKLDRCFDRHGFGPVVTLPVSPEFSVELHSTATVALVAPVMLEWYKGNVQDALDGLRQILERIPAFEEARLCLCLLLDQVNTDEANKEIMELTNETDAESDTGKVILFMRAKALRELGLATAARESLTALLRKEKQLSEALRQAARYERALAYEGEGKSSQARKEFERLFAEAPDYKDLKQRLGLE